MCVLLYECLCDLRCILNDSNCQLAQRERHQRHQNRTAIRRCLVSTNMIITGFSLEYSEYNDLWFINNDFNFVRILNEIYYYQV